MKVMLSNMRSFPRVRKSSMSRPLENIGTTRSRGCNADIPDPQMDLTLRSDHSADPPELAAGRNERGSPGTRISPGEIKRRHAGPETVHQLRMTVHCSTTTTATEKPIKTGSMTSQQGRDNHGRRGQGRRREETETKQPEMGRVR